MCAPTPRHRDADSLGLVRSVRVSSLRVVINLREYRGEFKGLWISDQKRLRGTQARSEFLVAGAIARGATED